MTLRLVCCWGLLALVGCAEREAAAPPQPVASPPATPKVGEPVVAARVVDDGRMLWASPTSGGPIDASLVPEACGAFLYVRPSALAASEEGQRVLRALGPLGEVRPDGKALAEIRTLSVAVMPGESYDSPEVLVGVDPKPTGELPLLAREFEQLLEATDAERHATLVFSPRFLLGDGGGVLTGRLAPLRELLLAQGRDAWAAASLSLHVDDAGRLYWELRVLTSAREPETRTAAELVRQAGAWGEDLAKLVAVRPWTPYSAAVVGRSPRMLAVVSKYARRGVDGRQAVVNGYAPAGSPHQLALVAQRLVEELGWPAAAPGGEKPAGPALADLPLAERLRRPVTIQFRRESLEAAVTILAELAATPIEIEGRDLQLEGITRNQMLGLDVKEIPAEEALVEVLRRANADPLAEGPADPRQRLVYVVEGDRVRVTTRAAAERRGDQLPAVFTKE